MTEGRYAHERYPVWVAYTAPMQVWYIYALLSMFFAGLHTFAVKVGAERKHDSLLLNALAAPFTLVLYGIAIVFTNAHMPLTVPLIALSVAGGFTYAIMSVLRGDALKYIDATIFFPLYKVLGPAVATLIGVFILSDFNTSAQLWGIALSCVVPLMLITRAENHRQKNLVYGIVLTVLGTSVAGINAAINASAVAGHSDFALVFGTVGYCWCTMFMWARFFQMRGYAAAVSEVKGDWRAALPVAMAIGAMQAIAFMFLLFAFASSNVSLVYSINAHYILIPIVLSIFVYSEHWNLQKLVAIGISVLALVLLH